MAVQFRSLDMSPSTVRDAERHGISNEAFVWTVCSHAVWMARCTKGKHSMRCSIKSIWETSADARATYQIPHGEIVRRRKSLRATVQALPAKEFEGAYLCTLGLPPSCCE